MSAFVLYIGNCGCLIVNAGKISSLVLIHKYLHDFTAFGHLNSIKVLSCIGLATAFLNHTGTIIKSGWVWDFNLSASANSYMENHNYYCHVYAKFITDAEELFLFPVISRNGGTLDPANGELWSNYVW